MSTVFRVEKTANYTVMSNCHLKDRRLSYKAKGLLSEMLSLPPDWDYTLRGLAVIAKDGVDSVRTAVRELEKYGYLVRSQKRDERGRMSVNEYIVYEKETVKKRFLELDDTHIEYGMTALDRSKSEVRNIRAYLITALYNAPTTMDSYYDAWVKHDLYGA